MLRATLLLHIALLVGVVGLHWLRGPLRPVPQPEAIGDDLNATFIKPAEHADAGVGAQRLRKTPALQHADSNARNCVVKREFKKLLSDMGLTFSLADHATDKEITMSP